MLEEYDLASQILVLSEKAEETFLAAGIPQEKLFRHQRGVDVERFTPGEPPEIFRAVFVGALIKRKGVHQLLEVWHRLALKDAELVLVGTRHDEIEPFLAQFSDRTFGCPGSLAMCRNAIDRRLCTFFPLPAKAAPSAPTKRRRVACPDYDREAGDVVQDEVNGIIVPTDDPIALMAAIERLYSDRELCRRLGAAGRQRGGGKVHVGALW
jgi:glycosyltransferase involved in cell wall biosynthesis